MKKETEGYFVIRHKNTSNKYIGDFPFCVSSVENAKPFETRTKAYKYMKQYGLDKDCIIVEVK